MLNSPHGLVVSRASRLAVSCRAMLLAGGFTILTRTDGLKFWREPMALYAKASSQRVGEWGTNLVHVLPPGARYAREDRNPGSGRCKL